MGVGVVESCDGRLRLAHSEVLTARRRHSLAKRLGHMQRELDRAIRDLAPAEVAIEEPFVARNVRAAMAVGQAQAVAMVAVDRYGLEMFSYSPRQVKKAVTDYGGSSKEQVQEMVKVLLDLQEPPQPSTRRTLSPWPSATSTPRRGATSSCSGRRGTRRQWSRR